MEEKKDIKKIDWEKIIRSYESNELLDDHGSVIIGARNKKPVFTDEDKK